jgi:hypothetical protein
MSEPLKDLRAKVTPETDAVLEAVARATGRDRSEIVREVLHDWALIEIGKASMVHKMLRAEGLPGIGEGIAGNRGV